MPSILYLQSTITSYKSQRDEQITIVSQLGQSVVCRASFVRLCDLTTVPYRHRERCSTGLHPGSFVILHLRRENNERSVGQLGGTNRHRRKSGNEFEIRG